MSHLAAILSFEGTELQDKERSLFKEADPCGFILFKRNISDQQQLEALTKSLFETVGRKCPILIDQEGGRVQRMGPPEWPAYSAASLYKSDLKGLSQDSSSLAKDLAEMGINLNCAPVLDMEFPQTDESVKDRTYSSQVDEVIKSGVTVIQSFLSNGITPVIKHLPGQGRADMDAHNALPRITAEREQLASLDYIPFSVISQHFQGQIWGMVGHCLYENLDKEFPASLSEIIIRDIIRDVINFDGFLVSDDISMGALEGYGDIHQISQKSLDAGCDAVLYCKGEFEAMERLVNHLPKLRNTSLTRYQKRF
ncbi:MAG: glycoside hydrolase [Micavibrio sp.]|nr:glycoside hydrolase [Micavibrio sp.]